MLAYNGNRPHSIYEEFIFYYLVPQSLFLGVAIGIGGCLMDIDTGRIVGLATLGVVISLVLLLVTIRKQRLRLVSGIVAIVLTAVSILAGLWGMGIVLRATAPVPDDVML